MCKISFKELNISFLQVYHYKTCDAVQLASLERTISIVKPLFDGNDAFRLMIDIVWSVYQILGTFQLKRELSFMFFLIISNF